MNAKYVFYAVLLVFGTSLILGSAGCSKAPQASTTAAAKNVDYWTCTMHPSVHSKTPGKCPICSMDLVPVMNKGRGGQPTSAEKEVASNAKAETQSMPGMQMEGNKGPATGDSTAQSKPSEFSVPVERQQQIGVTYTEVKKQPMRYYIRSVGMLEPDQTKMFEYVARVDGYLEELKVASPGDRVSAGQPLMTIYSPDLRATEQELVNLLNQPNNTGGHSSSDQLINAAKRRLLLWNVSEKEIAGLQQTRQPSDRLILRSPFDGVVEQVPAKVGMSVKSGDKLIGMIDLTRLWLWAEFYEDEIALLRPGQTVQITLSAFPTKTFDGQISVISPSIDPVKRTAKVRIDIPNPNSELRPGMYANVVAQIDAGEGLTVPVDAVLPTGMRMLVFVDKGSGKLEPRFIRVGRQFVDLKSEQQERYYQVMSGLSQGERIVSSANFLIDAESQVQGAIKTWQEPEGAAPAETSQPGLAEADGSPANALNAVLNTYLELRAHLAHDDFTGAKEHASELKANVEKLAASDPEPSSDAPSSAAVLAKLKESADHFDPPDLEQARIEFGQFSGALIALLKQSRPQLDQMLYLIQCPMWKKSPATWIQSTPEVSNPFMGQAMASCGQIQEELKPKN